MGDSIGEKVKRWRELANEVLAQRHPGAELVIVGLSAALVNAADECEQLQAKLTLVGKESLEINGRLLTRVARLEEALRHYDEWLFDTAEGNVARRALAEEPTP